MIKKIFLKTIEYIMASAITLILFVGLGLGLGYYCYTHIDKLFEMLLNFLGI